VMSLTTKNRRYKELDDKLGNVPDGIIHLDVISIICFLLLVILRFIESLDDVLHNWHVERSPKADQTYRQIGMNITEAKKTLGATSTVNTALLKVGVNGIFHC
jgi:hypothetical protein